MRSIRRLAAVVLSVLGLCGVGRETASAEPTAPRRGVVFIVEGIGGFEICATSARWALPHAGVPHEIREFVWTHGWGKLFRDLQDFRHMLHKADELAEEVRKIKADDPDCPVYLLGKSGGTGLVLAAAEQLPPGTVERIILLSTAVSPNYDLRPALRATKGEIVSFYSLYDQVILNWGTSQFGTIDRVYGPSAGLGGFVIPAGFDAADRALYQRLVQVPWHPAMILEGYAGGHVGTSMPGFFMNEVAPWLKTPAGALVPRRGDTGACEDNAAAAPPLDFFDTAR